MDKLCGNCKHWGGGRHDGEVFRQCMAIPKSGNPYGEDLEPVQFDDDYDDDEEYTVRRREIRSHKAVACDGSGYWAALRTREDYGCVLWEPK